MQAEVEPQSQLGGTVTLVEGTTFCVSDQSGDISSDRAQGLFFRDTRILSGWRLRLDGRTTQSLLVAQDDPYRATFISRLAPQGPQTELLLERTRYVGEGMREDLRLRNLGSSPVTVRLTLDVAADFADVFAVKEDRVRRHGTHEVTVRDGGLDIAWSRGPVRRGIFVVGDGARVTHEGLEFDATVEAHGQWSASVLVHPNVQGRGVDVDFPLGLPWQQSPAAERLRAWRTESPHVITTGEPALSETLRRSLDDLGSLRLVDTEHPGEFAVAAGAPWFMALFGRDSLLTSYMSIALEPTLAAGTLQRLARLQGTKVDPGADEQPGRILHEARVGADFPLTRGGRSVYYGTADATPLFVVVLGELHRWGVAPDVVSQLLPAADRALEWVRSDGDRDGDGFVEYQRATEHGLLNQGWKDSYDGINFADGRLAQAPIALAEVQGYAYAAFCARAELAFDLEDATTAELWASRAATLKRVFNERFWLPAEGYFAVGLDADKQPIDALTSNIGHCLWSGIVADEHAAAVAQHLMSPQMFTGWGVRTLASSMARYNPMSYHNGSVWPHDNALIAAGLSRYGYVAEAQRVATGILDAAAAFGGRLPELFCGFDRNDYPAPLPYPTSCSPQAWAAAAPLQLLRTLLRLDPDVPRDTVRLQPSWPPRYGRLSIDRLQLGDDRGLLIAEGDTAVLSGVRESMRRTVGGAALADRH